MCSGDCLSLPYDVVVALTADYYTALDISLQDVRYAAQSECAVFTSAMQMVDNTHRGGANGFANVVLHWRAVA